MKEIRRTADEKDLFINGIIEIEWDMFTNVDSMDGRASCQDDPDTFYIMRYSQHRAFGMDTLQLLKNNLESARTEGRNMVAEKYAYMMARTNSEHYLQRLRHKLPLISKEKAELIGDIIIYMAEFYDQYRKEYPDMAAQGRPRYDTASGYPSVTTYLEGELKTYSMEVLEAMKRDIESARECKDNLVIDIQKTTASFYNIPI